MKNCSDCSKILSKNKYTRCNSCNNKFIWATTNKKEIMSLKKKGIPLSKETKLKMKLNHADFSGKNNPMYGVHRFGKEAPCYGRKKELSTNWKGGITPLHTAIRNLDEYKLWQREIYKKDNYTCVECSNKGQHTHHIKEFSFLFKEFLSLYNQFSPIEDKETLVRLAINYAPFWDVNNGKLLCKNCHRKVHSK